MSEEKHKKYIPSSKQWQWSYELAKRILMSGWKPDAVIGLYRGGIFPAIVIEDYLRSNNIKTFHFPLHCQSYDANAAESTSSDVKVVDFPEYIIATMPEWKNVLIVDDICDTGKTLEAVKAKLLSYSPTTAEYDCNYNPYDIRTACLIWKPAVCSTSPTWWIKEAAADEWIVFPHEFCGIDLKAKLYHEEKGQ
jgi:hypoxanthine phosphoribosyltransferase